MHDTAHEEGKVTYLWVWAGLLILTAIEVVLAYEQIMTPIHMLEVLMILSVIKSALIIGWFMHLKGEIAVMKWTLMTSVVICLILMCIFFPDAWRVVKLGVQ
jgi:caa(3)-type oxidase subunit IV